MECPVSTQATLTFSHQQLVITPIRQGFGASFKLVVKQENNNKTQVLLLSSSDTGRNCLMRQRSLGSKAGLYLVPKQADPKATFTTIFQGKQTQAEL